MGRISTKSVSQERENNLFGKHTAKREISYLGGETRKRLSAGRRDLEGE